MIRLLIVDDDTLIRESLKIIIGIDPEIEIAGTAEDGKACIDFLEKNEADVILLDLRMPIMDGMEVMKHLKSKGRLEKHIKVLVLTTFDEDEHVKAAIASGALGFLLKNSAPDKIIAAIKSIALGSGVFDREVVNRLNTSSLKSMDAFGLSSREMEIAEKISEGLSNKEIAGKLFISEGTVKNYITSVLTKMDLKHRTQIAIAYLKYSQ